MNLYFFQDHRIKLPIKTGGTRFESDRRRVRVQIVRRIKDASISMGEVGTARNGQRNFITGGGAHLYPSRVIILMVSTLR